MARVIRTSIVAPASGHCLPLKSGQFAAMAPISIGGFMAWLVMSTCGERGCAADRGSSSVASRVAGCDGQMLVYSRTGSAQVWLVLGRPIWDGGGEGGSRKRQVPSVPTPAPNTTTLKSNDMRSRIRLHQRPSPPMPCLARVCESLRRGGPRHRPQQHWRHRDCPAGALQRTCADEVCSEGHSPT